MKARLFINTNEINSGSEFERFSDEVNHYSITPRTFESRNLVDRAWYIDQYSYSNNTGARYGIALSTT